MAVKDQVAKEAKRVEEDALYSAKSHFYASERWGNVHFWLGGSAAVIAAVAGVSALATFNCHGIVAGILSMGTAVLTAVLTFINPNERASAHQTAGNEYSVLKNDTRVFRCIQLNGLDEQAATGELKKLNDRRNKLNSESSKIPSWAFNMARKGIEEGQADYKVDGQEDNSENP